MDITIEYLNHLITNEVRTHYSPYFFSAQELVPPHVYKKLGARKCLSLFSPQVLIGLDALRLTIASECYINTWNFSKPRRKYLGVYKQSGFRHGWRGGATFSQHRLGRAFDIKSIRSAADMAARLKINRPHHKALQVFTRIEDTDYTKTWLHVDAANINTRKTLQVFKP